MGRGKAKKVREKGAGWGGGEREEGVERTKNVEVGGREGVGRDEKRAMEGQQELRGGLQMIAEEPKRGKVRTRGEAGLQKG